MFKNMKLLSILFALIIMILSGCSNNSLPFQKGEKYKENDGATFIEVQANNEWKMHRGRDRANEYALYRVEETEYKAGKYAVISLSLKEKFGKSDPLLLSNGPEKYLVSPTEKGISIKRVDLKSNNYWENFQKDFKEAKDKEAFLKKISEGKTRKYEKVN
ncbi:DUF5512 family protein [Bacillus cytotoxicus]|uniref:DUF5512 family protein n=1 Tax=Bacillus cereus group TaxID=86661 RepID=UPI000B960477|nr:MULTISPECIES: DUF5512 family protein [Bacillus cereus group]AWC30997.1 hypothetical protein CG483_022525 [Bacillus cytotoxicus]AWC35055.1 hypothetical protein CG482_022620 [Bacillus cytotoxicus]AWC39094.1 hypothetical protein CG481_022625 [Bacillus cytotoxicus]AWC43089.1 hypothetical protein CG480_022360 [Bacillus cytotoxicus]AWC46998.1 hypothetical protein CG479_021590 [Bacillus cytotoxicus]